MDATDRGINDESGQDLFQSVARPHRALAVIAVVEQLCLGWPGEDHGLAVEAHAVGKTCCIEGSRFERLVEAVNIDEDVALFGTQPDEIAEVLHRLNRLKVPIPQSNRGQ